eukprot:SAG31_NODE_3059_length_4678_cov_1.833657_7_plen_76_part_00
MRLHTVTGASDQILLPLLLLLLPTAVVDMVSSRAKIPKGSKSGVAMPVEFVGAALQLPRGASSLLCSANLDVALR